MKPKKQFEHPDLFRSRLDQILNTKHPLVVLAEQMDWSSLEQQYVGLYDPAWGRPAKSIRLMVGLHYLKHAFNQSDESVVARFLENPYWQYFCGLEHFTHELPLEPTTLVKWRQRIGARRLEAMLSETINTALRTKALKATDFNRLNVDTTVQEKAIAFPTDARLYHKARIRLVSLATERAIKLRQSYKRLGKQALLKCSRYAHARQFKRAKRMTRSLKTYLGRVTRDLERKADANDPQVARMIALCKRLLSQKRNSKNKLYSIDAPEVECIAKGKAHKKYEFGCKVGVVSTSAGNWVVGAQAFHNNPYDGHTLASSLEQSERISGRVAKHVHCDRGYRGHGYQGPVEIHVVGTGKRKKSRWERFWRRRRSAIEPMIGHLKSDNRMGRNYYKGVEGDRINAILAACGYNLRKLLRATFLPVFECFCTIFFKLSEWTRHSEPLKSPNKRFTTAQTAV